MSTFAVKAYCACGTPYAEMGTLEYFTATNETKYCNGNDWMPTKYGGIAQKSNISDVVATGLTTMNDFVATGNFAYFVGSNQTGLLQISIFNVSNASSPNNVGSVTGTTGSAMDVATNSTHLFVVQSNNLKVYSLAAPGNPTEVGSLAVTSIFGANLHVSGNYLYATSSSRLIIIDISTPASPTLVSSTSLSSFYQGSPIEVSGNYAYVVWSNKLAIIDVTNKSAPVLSSQVTISAVSNPLGLSVNGNYLYVGNSGNSSSEMGIVDVTNKSTPVLLKTVPSVTWVQGFLKNGSYLYVSTGHGDVKTLNIDDPVNPKFLQSAAVLPWGKKFEFLSRAGNTLVGYSNQGYFATFDLTPSSMPKLPEQAVVHGGNSEYIIDMAISGTKAVLTSSSQQFWIFDISNPSSMTYLGQGGFSTSVNLYTQDTFLDGDLYYQAANNHGKVVVYDISTPSTPFITAEISHSNLSGVSFIAKSGNTLYSVAGSGYFSIFNISNLASPVLLGATNSVSMSNAKGLVLNGNYAYVAQDQYIYVFDISNSASPSIVGTLNSADLNLFRDIKVSGSYLYAVTDGAFLTIDISTPTAPAIAAKIVRTNASAVATSAGYAYVYSSAGISVYDVANPAAPVFKLNLASGASMAMTIQGTTLFVAQYTGSSLRSVNISNPLTLAQISTSTHTGVYESVVGSALKGNFVLTGGNGNIVATNISNLATPTVARVVTQVSFNNMSDMELSGNYVYTTSTSGFQVTDVTDPSTAAMVGSSTNSNLMSGADVKVSGNYAYVLTASKLSVVDITTKTAPSFVTFITDADFNNCRRMDIDANYLYIACNGSAKLMTVSISTPTAPAIVGRVSLPGMNTYSVHLIGSDAVYVASSEVFIVNVTNRASPSLHSTFSPIAGCGGCNPTTSVVGGTTLYYPEYSGTTAWDVSDAFYPVKKGSQFALSNNFTPTRLAINSSAMIFTGSDKFAVVSVEALPAPYRQKFFGSLPGAFKDLLGVRTVGGTAYTLTSNGVFAAWSLANPLLPARIGGFVDVRMMSATSFNVTGNYLYAATAGSILVFDITNPDVPVFKKSLAAPSWMYFDTIKNMEFSGSYLYTNNIYGYVAAIDISAPANPVYVSVHATTVGPGLVVSGSYAYTCKTGGIAVLNISNPASITSGTFAHADIPSCSFLAAAGNTMAAINGTKLVLVDISTAGSPSHLGSVTQSLFVTVGGVVMSATKALVSVSGKIILFDITNPATPTTNDVYTASEGSFTAFVDPYLYAPNPAVVKMSTLTAELTTIHGVCSTAGAIEYIAASNVYAYCNGTQYIGMGPSPGAGGSGCSSPTAAKASLDYDTGVNKFRYCDGTNWRYFQ